MLALTFAVFELFGSQLIWIVARDCGSSQRVVTSLQNPKALLLACYCCLQRRNLIWKQLPRAAN